MHQSFFLELRMWVWWVVLSGAVALVVVGHWQARVRWTGWGLNWLDGLTRVLCRSVHGLHQQIQLPPSGPAIVAANHVSGLDPLLLIAASNRPIRFLIAREYYELPVLHWVFRRAGCIPVDRAARPEQALRAARQALERGDVVGIFPHGQIRLDSDPPARIKPGALRLAEWTGAPILAVRIDGVRSWAQGKVLLAPWLPSRVHLTLHPAIVVTDLGIKTALEHLTLAIETPSQP